MIDLTITSNLKQARNALDVTEEEIRKAVKTAEKKGLTWARREAARGLSRELDIPYRAANIRTRKRGKDVLWFGLDAISAKYLKGKSIPGAFTAAKLNGHFFKRKGSARLPLVKQELEIALEGEGYIYNELAPLVERKMLEFFFEALDKSKGRTPGASLAIVNAL